MAGAIVQEFSATYRELFTSSARYVLLWGGRGRGGSFTATNYFAHLITKPDYFRGYFMRLVFGDIRESLWRDFKDRIQETTTINPRAIHLNDSSMTATCLATGNVIMSKGFRKSSKDRTAKLKSLAGATHVVIEEADEIGEDDFIQLDDTLRSKKADIKLILIFNPPPKGHWIWRRWFTLVASPVPDYFRAIPKKDPELLSIFSTYLDNVANLNPRSVNNWRQYKQTKPDHYWTMIQGLISEGARGRIFKNWKPCAAMPNTYPKFYGLDWGYSGDPLALVEMEAHNRTLWVDRKIYATGILNDELDRILTELGIRKSAPIVADSAQPKDIEDMRARGWNFIAARKGPGSVASTINFLKQFDIFVTERSAEIWHEFENYAWRLDQYKNPTEEPIDAHNHAIDAIGYGCDRLRTTTGVRILGAPSASANGRTNYSM